MWVKPPVSPAPEDSSAAAALNVAPGSPPLANGYCSVAGVLRCARHAAPTPSPPGQRHNDQREDDEKDQPTWHGHHLVGQATLAAAMRTGTCLPLAGADV